MAGTAPRCYDARSRKDWTRESDEAGDAVFEGCRIRTDVTFVLVIRKPNISGN